MSDDEVKNQPPYAFVLPKWVRHSNRPISSVDVHPSGEIFATGGWDNYVKIWNFQALLDPANVKNKLIALLRDHTCSINCVRFSPDGDRAAELDSRKPLEIVVRQNLEPEPARRQLLRQRHEQHIYAAVNGIVGVVRRDDDHVLLFVRDARMIAVLPGDGEHVIPDIFADVRMMAENP